MPSRKDRLISQLEIARAKLLDLTMRNRLLNFKPTRGSTIRVIDEIPAEIYRILVLDQRKMRFATSRAEDLEDSEDQNGDLGDNQETSLTADEEAILWQAPVDDAPLADRHTDDILQTNLITKDLQKRLFSTYRRASSAFEEMGTNILYLPLGFLKWKEAVDSNQFRKAPLILIPVELVRTKVRSAFRLVWTGDDIITNISLHEKLQEQGVDLPSFDSPDAKSGVDSYFAAVTDAISTKKGWTVLSDIYLGFFSFAKFLLYRDLDPDDWPEDLQLYKHPLVMQVLDPTGEPEKESADAEYGDENVSAMDVFHVMDADPSQAAVIEEVKRNRNLVVEGPPGTGKSQTITNLIAELLADGKKILFVSEKMAALEVVKSRLDKIGLGDFCLELHSNKTRKKKVLAELRRCLNTRQVKHLRDLSEYSRHDQLRTQLNAYVKALRDPIGRTNYSLYRWLGIHALARDYFASVNREPLTVEVGGAEKIDTEQLEKFRHRLELLMESLDRVKTLTSHPWKGTNPGAVLPEDERELVHLIMEARAAVYSLLESLDELADVTGVVAAESRGDLEAIVQTAQFMAVMPTIDPTVLEGEEWVEPKEPTELLEQAGKAQAMRNSVLKDFTTDILEKPSDADLSDYCALRRSVLRMFKSRYRQLRPIIGPCFRRAPRGGGNAVAAVEEAIRTKGELAILDARSETGSRFFGTLWDGIDSDVNSLREFAGWAPRFKQELRAGRLTLEGLSLVSGDPDVTKKVKLQTAEVQKRAKSLDESVARLSQKIGVNETDAFGGPWQTRSFRELLDKFEVWEGNIGSLILWSRFKTRLAEIDNDHTAAFIPHIIADEIETNDITQTFILNLSAAMIRRGYEMHSVLGSFVGEDHDKLIRRFIKADKTIIQLNRYRLLEKLSKQLPRVASGASRNSEAGFLLGEVNRKRGHRPIRTLMNGAGKLIQGLKPCFLMSPLSIAQFLAPGGLEFDVIIFDEASQVRPEDGLGALLRGKQVCVMGDTRQLPPTSFFDHIVDDILTDEEEDEIPAAAGIEATESILHQCKKAFPTWDLRWHYRSRHDSLIAVSNQELYDNRLFVFPSAYQRNDKLGVHFRHLPDTVYDRGGSRANRLEARAVAAAALEHYRTSPDKSLGVGAFSASQQRTIEEEIELIRQQHPDMEQCFDRGRDEHFFVKNLETIQGDERDVIFVSVGYGKDQHGKLTMNFGPVTHSGGERRLNVLVTRAREKCVVFSNFTADAVPIDASDSLGKRFLSTYLKFAETRKLQSYQVSEGESESPFEDSVRDFLRRRGYEVRTQVGCAGFRLDLAIVDPSAPGKYLIGIECDGASYHSSRSARERDRLRQQILEDLDWKIHRVWSTDWFRNRAQAERRLVEAIELARGGEGVSAHALIEDTHSVSDYLVDKNVSLDTDAESIQEYKMCKKLPIDTRYELTSYSTDNLAKAIEAVVSVEAPMHVDDAIRRVRELFGYDRTGSRIREVLMRAVRKAGQRKGIVIRKSFLYKPGAEISARDWSSLQAFKAEQIAEDELVAAIREVIRRQHATSPEDLVQGAAKVVGFKAVYKETKERVEKALQRALDQKIVKRRDDGLIDIL